MSVITPTYNRSDVLPRAMNSVQNQTYDRIEHIIIDDGSEDNTNKVVKKNKGENVEYIKLDKNKGVAFSRNKGINISDGDVILFLDSDDELKSEAISKLVVTLKAEPVQCASVFGYQKQYKNTDTHIKTHNVGDYTYEDIIHGKSLGGFGGKMIRKEVIKQIGNIDESFPRCEDIDYFLRMLEEGYYMTCIDDVIFNRYYDSNQITRNPYLTIKGQTELLNKHGTELSPEHYADRLYSIGHAYAEVGNVEEARCYFKKCSHVPTLKIKSHYYLISTLFGKKGYDLSKYINNCLKFITNGGKYRNTVKNIRSEEQK